MASSLEVLHLFFGDLLKIRFLAGSALCITRFNRGFFFHTAAEGAALTIISPRFGWDVEASHGTTQSCV